MGETTANEIEEEDGRTDIGVGSSAVTRRECSTAWLPAEFEELIRLRSMVLTRSKSSPSKQILS